MKQKILEEIKYCEEYIGRLKRLVNLKENDKVIFIENSGVLSGNKGEVFTFKRFLCSDFGVNFWQSVELIEKYPNHNFGLSKIDIYDEKKYPNAVFITQEKLESQEKEFIKKYDKD